MVAIETMRHSLGDEEGIPGLVSLGFLNNGLQNKYALLSQIPLTPCRRSLISGVGLLSLGMSCQAL